MTVWFVINKSVLTPQIRQTLRNKHNRLRRELSVTKLKNNKLLVKISATRRWLQDRPWFGQIEVIFDRRNDVQRKAFYKANKLPDPDIFS